MMLPTFLSGALCLGYFAAASFFLRFWKRTQDTLFLMFALAFGLLGIERIILTFVYSGDEFKVYLIRLVAFILIIAAVIHKNRKEAPPS
jgi:hypothetical protein